MSAFIFKLTTAGLSALVNAANTGTQGRTIVSVGVTATAIAPGGAIANEIKRITTIAGDVVADDTIHVTIRDDGTDTYTVRGIGLYLDNGVLLGSYGQATPIIEKSSASILMLAVDARVLDASADISTLLFGDASFANPPATTTRQGVVELATAAETATGTDTARAVVPAGLKPLLDAKQPLDATLTAIAALVTAANQLIYATGPDTFATTALSGFMRTLLDDADAATARTTLGAQPLDATLTALAALATAADKLIYATGVDTFATAALTAFARSLLDDADAVSARATLGAAPLASPGFTGTPTAPTAAAGTNTTQLATTAFVQAAVAALIASSPAALDTLNELAAALGDDPNFATTMTNALAGKQPLDATLTALASVATAADKLIYATGADAFATTSLTAFARSLLANTSAATARNTLGAAPIASPAFTGTPTAPTAAAGTNTQQLASTEFVLANAMPWRGAMGGSVDLNSLTQPGIYTQSSNANAASGINYPVDLAGNLVVMDNGASITTQTYHEYNSGAIWSRSRYTTTWSAWKRLAFANDAGLRLINKSEILRSSATGTLTTSIPTSLFGGIAPAFVMFKATAWGNGGSDLRSFHVSAGNTPSADNFVLASSSDDTDQGGTAEIAVTNTFVLPYNAAQQFYKYHNSGPAATLIVWVIGYQP